ncbi:thioredoxin family protein [Rhizohabitans arisaemae]|uniref:thioredoxin family protein n=1 Tax=Rhizohabitans arisaemae TaxID=2720610 RepID=UPI0024B1028E|nr:thioredoxin family protein [Rhizohabitans arisaemae]
MLELTVLTVPDCPHEADLHERLAQALVGHPAVRLTTHVIDNEGDAARWGMHGSPTLLINGVDVFAAPDTPASVSCRLYRDETGPTGGAPSVTALREALRHASSDRSFSRSSSPRSTTDNRRGR